LLVPEHAAQDGEAQRLGEHSREGQNMGITRRHLVAAGALALGGVGLLRSSTAVAQSAEEAAVAKAVEALRQATFGQEKAQLEELCTEQLSYGHSDGRVENKAEFIKGVMTRKANLKSLTLSDHTIAVVGANAIARHKWASESETDGKVTSTRIGVLQVWLKQNGAWKLLARQAVRPPQPT
jgi:hypothetical protein